MTLVRDTYLAGKVVVVEHGRGIGSVYMHLSAAKRCGRVMWWSRARSSANPVTRAAPPGPHLHIAVRVSGGFVDPIEFFTLKLAPAPEATARR